MSQENFEVMRAGISAWNRNARDQWQRQTATVALP
jgi:hypothetical protein